MSINIRGSGSESDASGIPFSGIPFSGLGCGGAGAGGVARGYIQNVRDSIFDPASFCLIRRICISAEKETL
ncbi:hypothetical protein [Streptomyces sp. V2I9]|uniref:hypothetical protein n=1 Tax=Streptomyces sp. V2I9 TaxID=3042304 RepID=UPI0027D85C01|nr:hypothetical protein [Streptomyces sp. V2I9]